ncbi:hypothetical protein [Burkholderia sp. THE68]|jgi:hypothetical protein|uniref:hypothetical protein n=1 Tax=Burkholderia sp. THE68 TaxID=758782 RepID=UPI00138979DA|nr:hypothetical protein [Burkholderia sp. THE68]
MSIYGPEVNAKGRRAVRRNGATSRRTVLIQERKIYMKFKLAAFAAVALTFTGAAFAKDHGYHHDNGNHNGHKHHAEHRDHRDTRGHDGEFAKNGERR